MSSGQIMIKRAVAGYMLLGGLGGFLGACMQRKAEGATRVEAINFGVATGITLAAVVLFSATIKQCKAEEGLTCRSAAIDIAATMMSMVYICGVFQFITLLEDGYQSTGRVGALDDFEHFMQVLAPARSVLMLAQSAVDNALPKQTSSTSCCLQFLRLAAQAFPALAEALVVYLMGQIVGIEDATKAFSVGIVVATVFSTGGKAVAAVDKARRSPPEAVDARLLGVDPGA